jgi:putative tryptophan/tyrosine transport system substrate-binding protein
MKHRPIGLLLILALFAAPLAVHAQPTDRMRKIGVLQQYAENDLEGQRRFAALIRGLQDLGWQEGRNVALEIRYAGGKFDRLPTQVAELLQANVDLIVTAGTEPTEAARKATKIIPIVMATIGDPVGIGIVASLSRPGGNITGLSNQATDLSAKRLEMINGILHGLARLAVLWNPDNASVALKFKEIEAAARGIGMEVESLRARLPSEIDEGFQRAAEAGAKAVITADDVFLASHRARIVDLAMRYRLPVASEFRQFTDAGGLLSYGPDQIDMWRRAATYVDKIFKGAKPADLPVEQPMKFELVINLKTAQALGLTVPPALLFQADEVIR